MRPRAYTREKMLRPSPVFRPPCVSPAVSAKKTINFLKTIEYSRRIRYNRNRRKNYEEKITIVSLSFIGAAILWFICLIASQLFFDGNVFDKGISAFIWRFLIILLIVGFSGILLLTSVSIYEDNKTLAYVSGAMILLTALFALLFFIIGKYEKGFLSYCTLDLVIVSLLVNQITDMQYRAKNRFPP